MVDIKGYEGRYKVTTDGKIWSTSSNKWLNPTCTSDGVLKVHLSKEGTKKLKSVHRIVAEAYIDNPSNKTQVDHIDGNKQNNCVNNLRWCTNAENQAYRDEQGNSGSSSAGKQIIWGSDTFTSINALAKHIADIRGSKIDTVKKELKAVRYGEATKYGKLCKLL